MSQSTLVERGSVSRIAKRTPGQKHGPITRLMSPSDFGRILKPFVELQIPSRRGAVGELQSIGEIAAEGIENIYWLIS